jgi:RHS repeat-associated protein
VRSYRTPTDTYDYDAFGNKINSTGTTPNSYLYRGEFSDSDLGLYYLRARWMNPLTGRFLSRDPWDGEVTQPVTLHKYLYVGGDPINWWDPTGWDGEEDIELTGEVSEGAIEGEEALAKEISCVYKTAADLLDVVVADDPLSGVLSLGNVAIDVLDCSAQVPRTGGGKAPVEPLPDAQGPHTVYGTEPGSKGPYRQGFTFDGEGNFVGRTDRSTHGRGGHTNPHIHVWGGPNGGYGPPQPIKPFNW